MIDDTAKIGDNIIIRNARHPAYSDAGDEDYIDYIDALNRRIRVTEALGGNQWYSFNDVDFGVGGNINQEKPQKQT